MTNLQIDLTTDNKARAVVLSVSEQHVAIDIDKTDNWNAEGLLKLSAMLKGVAATLVAGALLLGLMTVADAIEWVPFHFDAAEAQDFE